MISTSAVQELKIGHRHYTFTVRSSPTWRRELVFPAHHRARELDAAVARRTSRVHYDLNLHRLARLEVGAEFTNARMWDDYRVLDAAR